MTTAIWWIRRDLRLHENLALASALRSSDAVVPLFILDDALLSSPSVGARRRDFLYAGLRTLDHGLRQRGSTLVVRRGSPADVLADVMADSGAGAIFAEEDFTPFARRRDIHVSSRFPLTLTGGLAVYPPGDVLKADGTPYTVFTPFSKAWKALPGEVGLWQPPDLIPTPPGIASLPIPGTDGDFFIPPGETHARSRLDSFTQGADAPVYHYNETRNLPADDVTSKLSPYLRFGMLSAERAVYAAQDALRRAPSPGARNSAESFLNELIWREFFIAVAYHFPHVMRRSFREQYDAIEWEDDEAGFQAWCEGRTGYPIVDAGMRQLAALGWMHNRVRMITASFLVKDLLIDWRRGERWFMQNLLDGDPAVNNGNWQWAAGTGTDAAPYFRVFNPILQGKKFDSAGDYVRRWVPELERVPARFIHAPWEMPEDAQREVGCVIGRDYPAPLIDHAFARERTLAAYKAAGETR